MCRSTLLLSLSGVKELEYHKYAKELDQNCSRRIFGATSSNESQRKIIRLRVVCKTLRFFSV